MPFNFQMAPPINWGQGIVDASATMRDTQSQIAQMRAAQAQQQRQIAAQMTGQFFQGFMGLAEQQLAQNNRLQLQNIANDQALSVMDREHQYGLNDWLTKNGLPDLGTMRAQQMQTGIPVNEQIQKILQKRQDDQFAQEMQSRGYVFGMPDEDKAVADDIDRQLQELNNDPAYTYQQGVYTPVGEQIRQGLEQQRASLKDRWYRPQNKPATVESMMQSGALKQLPDGTWAGTVTGRNGTELKLYKPPAGTADGQAEPTVPQLIQQGKLGPASLISPGANPNLLVGTDKNGKVYTVDLSSADDKSSTRLMPVDDYAKLWREVYGGIASSVTDGGSLPADIIQQTNDQVQAILRGFEGYKFGQTKAPEVPQSQAPAIVPMTSGNEVDTEQLVTGHIYIVPVGKDQQGGLVYDVRQYDGKEWLPVKGTTWAP